MRQIYSLFVLLCYSQLSIWTQVVDSTFGDPFSFIPGAYAPGLTGNDFSERQDRAYALLFLEDGKIIMAGHSGGENDSDFAFTRMLENGQHDQEAGPNGRVQLDLGLQRDSCLAAVRYGTDQMLLGGSGEQIGEAGFSALLIKADFDGNLNNNFGEDGLLFLDLPGQHEMITHLHPLPDGKILVAGNAFYGSSYLFPDSTNIFVGRLLEDGSVDSNFGTNGFIYVHRNDCPASILGDLQMYPDGDFIITAETYSPYPGDLLPFGNCAPTIYVSRYLSDGVIDSAFGEDGTSNITWAAGWAKALGMYEDGKIVVAGLASDGLISPVYTTVARLLSDGNLDSTFATYGIFQDYLTASDIDPANPIDLVIRGDEVLVGFSATEYLGYLSFGLLCFNNEGQLNPNFGSNGIFTLHDIYPWTIYRMKQIRLSADQQSLYFAGSYRMLVQLDNMLICKLDISDKTVALDTDFYKPQEVQLYPNPLPKANLLHIRLPDLKVTSNVHLQIYDSTGKLVMKKRTAPHTLSSGLDLSSLSGGVYFIHLSSEEGRYSGKLVLLDERR